MLINNIKGIFKRRQQCKEMYFGMSPEIEGIWATGNTLDECRSNLAGTMENPFSQYQAERQPLKIFAGAPSTRRFRFRSHLPF